MFWDDSSREDAACWLGGEEEDGGKAPKSAVKFPF